MKHELDRRVARELRMRHSTVNRVTSEFLWQVSVMLAEAGFALLNGFGTLRVTTHHSKKEVNLTAGTFKKGRRAGTRKVVVPSYLQVHFSKSKKLKELLNEHYRE